MADRPAFQLVANDPTMDDLPAASPDPEEPTPDEMWEAFWETYPRKVGKKATRLLWFRLDREQMYACLDRLPWWVKVWAARGDPEYIPHPKTFVYGERWEDELPQGFRPPVKSRLPVKSPEGDAAVKSQPRQPIPESVRLLLAKIKAAKPPE